MGKSGLDVKFVGSSGQFSTKALGLILSIEEIKTEKTKTIIN